ncbi:MAG: 1-acyl-sn-glycerol-3-phosphate acyltransferase [Corallococcus sp.]|nr:1-acyl-sn-glycerol-3-phosphate acyltransferase [Corallococcus sp.]
MNKFVYGLARVLRYLVRPFYPTKIYGQKKLEQKQLILVGNHISAWDPVLLYAWTKTHVSFMYKAEFQQNKFLRWAFDGLEFIPVNRGEVDISATKTAMRLLKRNRILGLFPEGSRNPNIDCLLPLKTGTALFAIKTKSPLRAFYVWDKAKIFRKSYYIIGEEFTLEEFYDKPITKELLNAATEVIRLQMDGLRIKLNGIMEEKGIKHRKRTHKEIEKINAYNAKHHKPFAEKVTEKVYVENPDENKCDDKLGGDISK